MSKLDEILERQANTIALGIMGNVPGAEGTPIFTKPEQPKQQIKDLLLELIGEDEEVVKYLDISPTLANLHLNRNDFRVELRQKVKDL